MIERVARKLAGKHWNENPAYRDHYKTLARAVFEEMRNVDDGSPAILKAGMQSLYSCSFDPELEDARKCWQAMIDAALKEEE